MRRNVFSLRTFCDLYLADLVFISEPLLFQADLPQIMEYFKGEYKCSLSSEDLLDPDLSFRNNKTKGGTMILWRNRLDPYVTVMEAVSTSFLFIVLDIPGTQPSIHGAVYLPTAGKEVEYMSDLAKIKTTIEDLKVKHPEALLFLRGDANSSKAHKWRSSLFSDFCYEFDLTRVKMDHLTYHHFLGNGTSDSDLDVLLHSHHHGVCEEVLKIECKLENPMVDSHHDLLVSSVLIPAVPHDIKPVKPNNICAPKVSNDRHQTVWSEAGITEYNRILSYQLPKIRDRWLLSSSPACMSILLQLTNMVMSETAAITNKIVSLKKPIITRSTKLPKSVIKSNNRIKRVARKLKLCRDDPNSCPVRVSYLKEAYNEKKKHHRKVVRQKLLENDLKTDLKTNSILMKSTRAFFKNYRALKNSNNSTVNELRVRDNVYLEHEVGDGLYDSISFLKTKAHCDLPNSETYNESVQKYEWIMELCKNGQKMPKMTLETSEKILKGIKPSVNDLYSMTGYHYLYAGHSGLQHFHLLLNALIEDLNNVKVDELNEVWACVLYKGHKKDRRSENSYRTISICPFISKGLDTYISYLYSSYWDRMQEATQYQGKKSSHALASVLVTELIQHSLNVLHKPMYILYLDARSAFDLVIRELLITKLYDYGIRDQGLLLLDERLKNRKTYCEWEKKLMGPIQDLWGLEQGGKNSSDLFKVYNNDQIASAQASQLGIPLGGDLVISAIGQADDIALVSNNIFFLQCLLDLSLSYCEKHQVKLSTGKTKLQAYTNNSTRYQAYYAKVVCPVNISGDKVEFTDEAEHVGVVRSTEGNTKHIMTRITAHRRAIAAIAPMGLHRRRRINPSASIRIQKIFRSPVLLSGIPTLVLKASDISLVHNYLKRTIQQHLKLPDSTPHCVVAFLGGTLPGKAEIHLRQLGLFGMISRLPGSVLYQHARNSLQNTPRSANSWFQQIRDLCLTYGLPHPLSLLENPPNKSQFKTLVRSRITDHWEQKLRSEASNLSSLLYFKPAYMSLAKPHRIFTSCGSRSFEVHKSFIVAKMLSGRYLTDMQQRHWTNNKTGYCLLPGCTSHHIPGTLEHLLLFCPSLNLKRLTLLNLGRLISQEHPALSAILTEFLSSDNTSDRMQLLLDCTVIPQVVRANQTYGPHILDRLLYFGRTWCYNVHRERVTQLGLLKFR